MKLQNKSTRAWTKSLCVALPISALLLGVTLLTTPQTSYADDVSGAYSWNPVRLGAGGFVTGFLSHPLDAKVRYCRTDVGNAYRWDDVKKEWFPLAVRSATTGLPASITRAPEQGGVAALGVDANNKNIVYMAYVGGYSSDVAGLYPTLPGNIYKSTDGGVTFVGGDLNVPMSPNSDRKYRGERISVDPSNSNNVWYGTEQSGLWRSTNGGVNWTQVSGSGAPGTTTSITRVLFGQGAIFAVQESNSGGVFKSIDGGTSWTNIATGQALNTHAGWSVSDAAGSIYVVQEGAPTIWKYKNSAWSQIHVDLDYSQNPFAFALAPNVADGQTIYANSGNAFSASYDGGAHWTLWGPRFNYANTLAWLPQLAPNGRSTGGMSIDVSGTLWVPQGNEGMLYYKPTGNETYDGVRWTIDSVGIEEFVTHDVTIPPGGKPIVSVEDATGLLINDPSQFTAKQISLQSQLISNGNGVAYCPNAPSYIVATSADVNYTGSQATDSGYSIDGGQTWTKFGSEPGQAPATGSIAVSRRNGWGLGSDHLVYLISRGDAPYYSKDGGTTWNASTGFPSGSGYWQYSLKQRQLKADPFIADKFYCGATWSGGFYVSIDGGVTWQVQPNAGLPQYCHHGQLAVNYAVQNDLWFVDGWEGASAHGLWHSTNGGQNFTKMTGIDYALTVELGARRGQSGDALYTVYFYGKLTGDDNWGVFRSTNGGTSWDRIAYYPFGIIDQPTCLAASWDTFGLVYIGFNGNSFVYGKLTSTALTDGLYAISPRSAPSKCIDFNNNGTTSTGLLDIWDYLGTPAQQWNVSLVGTNVYKVSPLSSPSSAWDVFNWATANGSPVGIYTYNSQSNQQWQITPTGTGYYYLAPTHAPLKALQNVNAATANGTGLEIWDNTGQANAQWKFTAVSASPVTPVSPTGLATTVTAGSTTINLTWTDNSTNEQGFRIERTLNTAGSWTQIGTVGANSTTYADTTTTAGTTYYYRVSAYNSAATSGYSNTATRTLVPAIPTGVTATAGATGTRTITVAFTAATGATSYTVYRSTSSGGTYTQIGTTTTTSFANTGLTANTTYYYKVAAVNAGGGSNQSAVVSARAR